METEEQRRARESRLYIVTVRRRADVPQDRDAYGPFSWDQAKEVRKKFGSIHDGFAPRMHLLRTLEEAG